MQSGLLAATSLSRLRRPVQAGRIEPDDGSRRAAARAASDQNEKTVQKDSTARASVGESTVHGASQLWDGGSRASMLVWLKVEGDRWQGGMGDVSQQIHTQPRFVAGLASRYRASQPPSTRESMACDVIGGAGSQEHQCPPAKSSGSPQRPAGMRPKDLSAAAAVRRAMGRYCRWPCSPGRLHLR